MQNLLIAASRNKYRFASPKGQLSLESLWDLPLTSKNEATANLDSIAQALYKQLQENRGISFVGNNNSQAQTELANKLELVKLVIAVKQQEAADRTQAERNKVEKQKLLSILESKEEAKLANLTEEEIRRRLAYL